MAFRSTPLSLLVALAQKASGLAGPAARLAATRTRSPCPNKIPVNDIIEVPVVPLPQHPCPHPGSPSPHLQGGR